MTTPGNQLRAEVKGLRRRARDTRLLKMAAILTLISAWAISATVGAAAGRGQTAATTEKQVATTEKQGGPVERVDYLVREDYFARLAGDDATLERAIKTCEDALAKNPKHAEALVWHGSGLMLRSRFAFQKGDIRNGAQWWDRGLAEMDEAMAIAPSNIGVLIARG